MNSIRCFLAAAVLATACVWPVCAQTPSADFNAMRRADGARLAPERFLREYDSLTVFFDQDAGPKAGGPEDHPEKYVVLSPRPVGAWMWLGARALQFRPAEPWTPLRRYRVSAPGLDQTLTALLPAPSASEPKDGVQVEGTLSSLALSFATPVEADALARSIEAEIRPAPGGSSDNAQKLTRDDFEISLLERAARSKPQTYVMALNKPIGEGRALYLKLRLSDQPGLDAPAFAMTVRTAEPFAATDADCGRGWSGEKHSGVLVCKPLQAKQDNADSDNDSEEGETAPLTTLRRAINLSFNAAPQELDVLSLRNALRISPPVDDLKSEVSGRRLIIAGKFSADRVYRLDITPNALADDGKRMLAAPFSQSFAFAAETPMLEFDAGAGLMERFGPQFAPLRGRAIARADVRIHPIDPLSRDFWPFPKNGVTTDDAKNPPLAGNEPQPWTSASAIEKTSLAERIQNLGSPPFSQLVDLPAPRGGGEAKFGLDLKKPLAQIAGADRAGAYLIGLRSTASSERQWLRAQVTDLALSAVEERAAVRFFVTSLASAAPVADAIVTLEGESRDQFVTLAQGRTDAQGLYVWSLAERPSGAVRRITVTHGSDVLALAPEDAKTQYAKENWSKAEDSWLSWTSDPGEARPPLIRTLCHVFTERPIYRPQEPVLIKGYVRDYRDGDLRLPAKGGVLIVTGPDKREWRIPVKLDEAGGFYHKFDVAREATGDYLARFVPDSGALREDDEGAASEGADKDENGAEQDNADQAQSKGDDQNSQQNAAPAAPNDWCGQAPFKSEAYRLPTFEVVLQAPQMVALDGVFKVDLLARYFAGGLAAERPIKWRAAQFPYVWTPPSREGFLFSTDQRFSGESKFKSNAVLERETRTDAGGGAQMTFDATIEPTAQPRRYSIEATVTGDDEIQVRNVVNIIATPPFALGLKTSRYVERPGAVAVEAVTVDGKGAAVAGQKVAARFIRRNWSSMLQASDFTQSAAKYVTEAIDEVLEERTFVSAQDAEKLKFSAKESGVYVVQLESYDKLGRRQSVSVDLFVGGATPVSWSRPPARTAQVTTDKDAYAPGETATLLVQSPFQTARALAIVEEPGEAFRYQWVEIANGFGRFQFTADKKQTPKLAVHFLILRGRADNGAPDASAPADQGKPITIAATKWVEIKPVKNIVTVKLEAPPKARPGQEVEAVLRLSDDQGKPLAGEATFWMVDQAVLSLAKERPLDLLPSFMVDRPSKMALRDSRSLVFGVIPMEEIAGGDAGLEEWGAETNVSVRKNFTPVPIYLPNVKVGPDGVARIKIKLPDTLTIFKLRAKAASGADRFGYGVGEMMIRQELVAQPALPRFVRPGDQFDVGLIARVVEGPGGAGQAEIAVKGANLADPGARAFEWTGAKPARIDMRASAPPDLGLGGSQDKVLVRMAVTRAADGARDGVEVELPARPDRAPIFERKIFSLAPGQKLTFDGPPADAREKTFSRKIIMAADDSIVKLTAGLQTLIDYPYGCAEQRISRASGALAMKALAPLLGGAALEERLKASVRTTIQAIEQSIDPDGLVGFWPHTRGNVSLTAWSLDFLDQAQKSGEPVDKNLMDRLANVLKLALRSDYPLLLRQSEMTERVSALAALTLAGRGDDAYIAEFARRADFLSSGSVAQTAIAAAASPNADRRLTASLTQAAWSRVRVVQQGGAPTFGGVSGIGGDAFILPSETSALADILRAFLLSAPQDGRIPMLREGLLRLGQGDGWGDTRANAAALRALAQSLRRPSSPVTAHVERGGKGQDLTIDANRPLAVYESAEAVSLVNTSAEKLTILVESSYTARENGAKAAPVSMGFALTRGLARIVSGAPAQKLAANEGAIVVKQGDVIEETAELSNPEDRVHVAIVLPLAAGMEPLNPNLATAPPEARPSSGPTLAPDWVAFTDDCVTYAYNRLPKGVYRFAFRTRAQYVGIYALPQGVAEAMYARHIRGMSAGASFVVEK